MSRMGQRMHHYSVPLEWTGNLGAGTQGYRGYARAHLIGDAGKAALIPGSSDPAFLGDAMRYNPEELLVAALSACHMLWFLHLCAAAGLIVTGYRDDAEGVMQEEMDGAGQFASVVLRPAVTFAQAVDSVHVTRLHDEAHHNCFIARSVNFPVAVDPRPLTIET